VQTIKKPKKNTLRRGQSLHSKNEKFELKLRNCNLNLYKLTNEKRGEVLWRSNTLGQGTNCKAIMKANGNFVIVSGERTVWSTYTSGTETSPYTIILRNTGNFILLNKNKKCLWATKGCPPHERAKIEYNPTTLRNIRRRLRKLIKRFKKPIFTPVNRATEKPEIKNRRPKEYVPPKKERTAGPKAKIKKKQIRNLRRHYKNFRRLKRHMRKTGLRLSPREWKKIKKENKKRI